MTLGRRPLLPAHFPLPEMAMKLSAGILVAGLLTVSAQAAEQPPGAAACSGCHPAGQGVETPAPRLNGRSAAEISAAMASFRTGARPATVMDRIAKGFTEPEAQAIAAWFAAQPN
jgi:cytochrome c553